jgi:hypothetical protein
MFILLNSSAVSIDTSRKEHFLGVLCFLNGLQQLFWYWAYRITIACSWCRQISSSGLFEIPGFFCFIFFKLIFNFRKLSHKVIFRKVLKSSQWY